MEIIVIGSQENFNECQAKFGSSHQYFLMTDRELIRKASTNSVIFDFDLHDLAVYKNLTDIPVFVNSVFTTLAQVKKNNPTSAIFGFCGMPTFLNRSILETVAHPDATTLLEKICQQLNTPYKVVKDQVGMITPRIISMIINEAYFAVEGNVASRSDIDLAMKLGTNYPYGPFEWCKKIGIKNVYRLLDSVYRATNDERYTICNLLRQEAEN